MWRGVQIGQLGHHGGLLRHQRLALRRGSGIIAAMQTQVHAVDAVLIVTHPATLEVSVGVRGQRDSS